MKLVINKGEKMESEEIAILAFFGFLFALILVAFLAMPVTGTIFGLDIEMPIIGWIGLGALTIFVLIFGIKVAMSR